VAESPLEPFSVGRIDRTRTTVVQAIVERLKSTILRGELPAGSTLPAETELCEMLGVSRATLREALQVLEQLGVIIRDAGPRRRLMVGAVEDRLTRLALRDLVEYKHVSFEEVFEVLETAEPLIAKLAATRATGADREELRKALEALASAPRLHEAEDVHTRLHDLIAAASHNRLWLMVWRSIDVALEPMKEIAFGKIATVDGILRLHIPLARAVLDGDEAQSVAMSKRHVSVFRRAYERSVAAGTIEIPEPAGVKTGGRP
jgi:GntR family transcriptional repressor for pyruvate dehydrogenase complex